MKGTGKGRGKSRGKRSGRERESGKWKKR